MQPIPTCYFLLAHGLFDTKEIEINGLPMIQIHCECRTSVQYIALQIRRVHLVPKTPHVCIHECQLIRRHVFDVPRTVCLEYGEAHTTLSGGRVVRQASLAATTNICSFASIFVPALMHATSLPSLCAGCAPKDIRILHPSHHQPRIARTPFCSSAASMADLGTTIL